MSWLLRSAIDVEKKLLRELTVWVVKRQAEINAYIIYPKGNSSLDNGRESLHSIRVVHL